jgi:hypothetical protein
VGIGGFVGLSSEVEGREIVKVRCAAGMRAREAARKT